MTDRLDLPVRYRREVEALLAEHVPDADVWAYGSRVKGRSHPASDLDLVLCSPTLEPIPVGRLSGLEEALEESNIPILVQTLDWARLPASFHEEIKQQYVVLQGKPHATVPYSTTEDSPVPAPQSVVGKTLGDVAEIVMGQSPPGSTVSSSGETPLLNGPTEFGPSHPTPTQFTTDSRKFASIGDILFCVRGSTTGRMNWADQTYAIGRGVAAIRHRTDPSLQHLVRAVIESELPQLLAQATGSTFPNVSAQQLSDIFWPDIELEDQQAFAKYLRALDDKIELSRRMSKTLETVAHTLFKSWFVNFDPVRTKAAGREPPLPAHVAELFPDAFQSSELGPIPETWTIKEFGDVADVVGGTTPSTKVAEYWGGSHCWATPRDLAALSGPVLLDTQRKVTDVGLKQIGSGLLPPGTLLLSSRAPIGYLAISEVAVAINQGIIAVPRRESCLPCSC